MGRGATGRVSEWLLWGEMATARSDANKGPRRNSRGGFAMIGCSDPRAEEP